ncbi:MAG: ADYC domain-containing protein [Kofleriaceae bacterium]
MKTTAGFSMLLALVGACAEAPELGSHLGAAGPGDGTREQGRFLLGELADAIPGRLPGVHFAASSAVTLGTGPATLAVGSFPAQSDGPCLSVVGGPPGSSCASASFTNAVLTAVGSAVPRLRIRSSLTFTTPGLPGQRMTGYVVQQNAAWATPGAPPSWAPYCVGGRLAFPLAGEVNRDGTFAPFAAAISFACSEFLADGTKPVDLIDLTGNGVAGKAMAWAFIPDSSGFDGTGTAIDGRELHAVAVGAGRADYCRNGVPHTLDATSIQIEDLVTGNLAVNLDPADWPGTNPVSTTPVDPTVFATESVWGRLSANGHPVLLCLSKARWQSLPPADRCVGGNIIRDPRVHLGDAADAVFCDDAALLTLTGLGAVAVVRSQWNDLGLWRWHKASGDYYTTTVGLYGGTKVSTPPAPGYEVVPAPELQGTLMTSVGKDIVTADFGVAAGTFVELQSCRKSAGGDWATDRVAWLSSHGYTTDCKTEGYVWSTPPAASLLAGVGLTAIELKRWSNGSGDVTASVARPTTAHSAGGVIGWILAPATW